VRGLSKARRMFFYEFQVLAILLVLNLSEVLDLATTWFYMRLSGKPFRVIEKNPRMIKLGFGRSAILGPLLIVIGTAVVLILSPWWFRSLPITEVLLPILCLVLCLYKFKVVISNFCNIRKRINEEKKKVS
jgi:hypothetical protein